MKTPAERHMEKLAAQGGGRLEIRLLEGNRARLLELSAAAAVSRERLINDMIESAWKRLQKKLDNKS